MVFHHLVDSILTILLALVGLSSDLLWFVKLIRSADGSMRLCYALSAPDFFGLVSSSYARLSVQVYASHIAIEPRKTLLFCTWYLFSRACYSSARGERES